jgi:trans-2,3-dihydro-3-hydroxyanthranilate isomerase
MVLELGIGPIACHATSEQAPFGTTAPLKVLATLDVIKSATAIGIAALDVVLDTHPPTTASIGLQFTLTKVVNRHILSQAKININALKRFAQSYPQAGRFGQYVYTRSDSATHKNV